MCVVCIRECVSSPLTASKRKWVVGCVCMCVVVYESMVRKEERRNKKHTPSIHTLIYTHTPTMVKIRDIISPSLENQTRDILSQVKEVP
jgi:hypothetical protein